MIVWTIFFLSITCLIFLSWTTNKPFLFKIPTHRSILPNLTLFISRMNMAGNGYKDDVMVHSSLKSVGMKKMMSKNIKGWNKNIYGIIFPDHKIKVMELSSNKLKNMISRFERDIIRSVLTFCIFNFLQDIHEDTNTNICSWIVRVLDLWVVIVVKLGMHHLGIKYRGRRKDGLRQGTGKFHHVIVCIEHENSEKENKLEHQEKQRGKKIKQVFRKLPGEGSLKILRWASKEKHRQFP